MIVRKERKEDIMFGDNRKSNSNNGNNNNNNNNVPRPQFMQSEPRLSTTDAYSDDDYAKRSSSAASPMSPYYYDPVRSLLFHLLLFIC